MSRSEQSLGNPSICGARNKEESTKSSEAQDGNIKYGNLDLVVPEDIN